MILRRSDAQKPLPGDVAGSLVGIAWLLGLRTPFLWILLWLLLSVLLCENYCHACVQAFVDSLADALPVVDTFVLTFVTNLPELLWTLLWFVTCIHTRAYSERSGGYPWGSNGGNIIYGFQAIFDFS